MEAYVIDEIEYFEDKIEIHCHIRQRGLWYKSRYYTKEITHKVRRIEHMMLEDKPVILLVRQRQFYLGNNKKKWESLPGVSGKKRTSNEFCENTLRELQRDNYSGTGFKRGKSGMYTSKLLDSLEFDLLWPESLTKLGLDGKYVRGNELVHNVTNLSDKRITTVLPNLSQKQLKKFSN